MARIRTIKPEFFTSLTNAQLAVQARLTFIGLWTHVDDEGRCVDNAALIKAAVWPMERSEKAIEADLVALEKLDKIIRYRAMDTPLLQITEWRTHQVINRARPSKYPAPDTEASWTNQ